MNYCVRIADADSQWLVVSPQFSRERVDGVKLVTEVPEFLGLFKTPGPLPRAAIVVPGSSSGRVVIALDETGLVRLVICPDKDDGAELGPLMADLLATSGRYWQQPYEALTGPFEKQLGSSLEDVVGERAGKGWDIKAFRAGVEKSLKQGRFPVIILTNDNSKALQDMLNYLKNMNFEVSVLGYRCARGKGVEVVLPVSEQQSDDWSVPKPSQNREMTMNRRPHGEQFTAKASIGRREVIEPEKPRESFTSDKASPEQQKIIDVLVQLDDLGLIRQGMEYFVPGFEKRDSAEGSIVIAVDEDRWPSPKSQEVVVVVRTDKDHLAGHFGLSPEEIEEFLESLPRVQRKEHRGAILLRAANTKEAEQLVNELKALKEVTGIGA